MQKLRPALTSALLKRVSHPAQQGITPDFAVQGEGQLAQEANPLYPDQQKVFEAVRSRPRGRDEIVIFSGPSAGETAASPAGLGGANFSAPDTATHPDAAGSPALAIVTAADPAADMWTFSWTRPEDLTQTWLYTQVRYLSGADALTDANFVASGTLFGDWALDVESNGNWLVDGSSNTGDTLSYNLFLTASPDVTGDCQWGVYYKNGLGNLGHVATASATF